MTNKKMVSVAEKKTYHPGRITKVYRGKRERHFCRMEKGGESGGGQRGEKQGCYQFLAQGHDKTWSDNELKEEKVSGEKKKNKIKGG